MRGRSRLQKAVEFIFPINMAIAIQLSKRERKCEDSCKHLPASEYSTPTFFLITQISHHPNRVPPATAGQMFFGGKIDQSRSHIYLRSCEVRTKMFFDNKLQALVTQKKHQNILIQCRWDKIEHQKGKCAAFCEKYTTIKA